MTDEALGMVLSKFGGVRRNGTTWMALCPAHEDRNPSLSVGEGDDGKVLLHCHAGCELEAILTASGLNADDLFVKPLEHQERKPRGEWTPRGEATAVYDYTDENGELLFQVLRTADKQFPARRPDPSKKSGWTWNLGDTRRTLYRLPAVIEAVAAGETVWIVEGEKDVEALVRAGFAATCNPGGAGKWRPEYCDLLTGADVVIAADADAPGRKHARSVLAMLRDVARHVEIVESPDCKDVAEHLGRGLTVFELVTTSTDDDPPTDLAPDLYEFLAVEDRFDWVVPGLIERGDRLMLTGFEGWGKSTLIRQIAICLAAGIHPFTLASIEPVRVLLIDLENGAATTRRKLRPLEKLARDHGRPVPPGGLRVTVRPQGIDLLREDDQAWLIERVVAHKPDVLFIGPLYRLHNANPADETAARTAAVAIDAARLRANCAVIIEAHAGHGDGFQRGIRPIGSSLWLRWPEFGFGLQKIDSTGPKHSPVGFAPWRGPREERDWPDRLEHSAKWPWIGVYEHGMPTRDLRAVESA